MLESIFRECFQKNFVDPFLKQKKIPQFITPNRMTLAALITGINASIFIGIDLPILGALLLLISGYLDILDGSLARATQQSSSIGSVFDIMADRIVEFSVILGFYFLGPAERAFPCLLMLGSILICVTSFLVVAIFTENNSQKSFHYSPGIMERTEAFLFFIVMILSPKFFVLLSYIFTILVLYTALHRIYEFSKNQRKTS